MAQLQNLFRQRYSKLGNTRKQLFHAWRSFTFDENTETIDSYVIRIRQVATLLGYGEPQILEVFKNTLPTKLYWVLFPMEDLRQAVETVKRILTKEKLDRQLTGQTSTGPFMNIRDGNDKRVSFNARDELGDKIDKLTVMMSKLVAKDSHERKPFKPQIYKSRGRSRSHDCRVYQTRPNDRNRRYDVNHSARQNYRGNRFREDSRTDHRQDTRERYTNERNNSNDRFRDRNRSRDRNFTRSYGRNRSSDSSRSRSGSRTNTNRDRIRCYECREYDHFARDCPNSREERDLEHLQHMLNMEEQEHRDPPAHSSDEDSRSPLNFLPLDFKMGRPSEDNYPTVGQYLSRDQTRHIYKKIETGESINADTIQQEVEQEKQLNKLDDDSGEENPCRELVINNAEKIEAQKTQMEQWSILSNKLNYIQHSRLNSMDHSLDIRPINKHKSQLNDSHSSLVKEFREVDFGKDPQNLQEEYLDVYEGIQMDIVSTNRFDENSDISTTYLGQIEQKGSQNKLKAEESFPISENGYTTGKLLDGTKCQLLLDTGARKSFMSKSFYMHCKSLHTLPKFAATTQKIQVGNGQCISVLFVIPVIIEVHNHRFEIYTLVSEIHENVDLVLGIKNVFELEGVINSRDCRFEFLNRSVPIYPEEEVILKPDEKKLVKVKAPFVDEISGLAIIKIIDGKTSSTLSIKLKFTNNKAILDIRNVGKDTMILSPKEMIGIVDIRSLGYYKIKQSILQQNLSKFYKFEEAGKLCKYFNKFLNTLKKDREQVSLVDKYPWLDPEDKRRNVTDR